MTDSKAATATPALARLRRATAAVTPYAAALLVRARRAMRVAASPALRAWFRPSLRRRIAAAIVLMSLTGCFVVAGILETIDNLFLHEGYFSCSGIQSVVPALPVQDGCFYNEPVPVYSLIVMILVIALTIWGCWLLAGWALSPLKATAETVRRLGPQNLGQRIGLASGEDQFKELADAIDDALDRLAAGYESQRGFAPRWPSSAC